MELRRSGLFWTGSSCGVFFDTEVIFPREQAVSPEPVIFSAKARVKETTGRRFRYTRSAGISQNNR